MNQQGKPWFMAVNLVNPHDTMFYNTDAPGQNVQDNSSLGQTFSLPYESMGYPCFH